MRKLLLLIFMFPIVTFSQDIETYLFPINSEGKESLSEIVYVELKKDLLYSNAQEWVAKTFGDYKSVIQFEDKDSGKLILKGFSKIPYKDNEGTLENIKYTITIECKDLKYRYTISDIEVEKIITTFSTSKKTYDRSDNFNQIRQYKGYIDSNNSKIDALKKKDRDGLKKKEIKADDEEIEKLSNNNKMIQSFLIDVIAFVSFEHKSIIELSESLKRSMLVNNDF